MFELHDKLLATPVPLEYKALGGEANQLAPKDLLELALDTLLNSVGVPVELYRGGLTMQPTLTLPLSTWDSQH